MLDQGLPTKKNPKPREPEKLFWAGTPYLRKRSVFLLFVLWMVMLIVPAMLLHELVDEVGGWVALSWALMSVFVFVPRMSRGSREVFALSNRQMFISKRSMYCSIQSVKANYSDIASAKLTMHRDGSGTFTFTVKIMYHPTEYVVFDRVRDVRGCCRVLAGAPRGRGAGCGLSRRVEGLSRLRVVPWMTSLVGCDAGEPLGWPFRQ